ncbi:MAG TPA: hypothetical protein VLA34_08105, partial [Candidatus Krumholzibacterium sp.]|nr:hypothetical protein [Candidatus Krumholzibacterium sp.]
MEGETIRSGASYPGYTTIRRSREPDAVRDDLPGSSSDRRSGMKALRKKELLKNVIFYSIFVSALV